LTASRTARVWSSVAIAAAALLGSPPAHADDDQATIARIPVAHRFASELEGPARTALTPQGTLVVDGASNSFIVRDTPSGIAALRSLLAALDVAPRQVTVNVRTWSREELERSRAEVHAGDAAGGVAGGNPPPERSGLAIGLVLSGEIAKGRGRIAQTVVVQSGQDAEIHVGGTQPVAAPDGRRRSEIMMLDFGQALRVRPTVLGDGSVRLDIQPSDRSPLDPRSGVASARGLSTVVVVRPGDAVVIGGVERSASAERQTVPASNSSTSASQSLVYSLDVSLDEAR